MQVPDELRYTSDHEWVAVSGTTVRIGITDYAQHELGDVVYAMVPAVGAKFAAGDTIGEVESTKSVSDIYSPVSGSVVAANAAVADTPELFNSDPYGAAWICEIECSDPSQLDGLMDAAAYRALIDG